MKADKIKEAQTYLQEMHVDGWLLYDFHRNNDLAHLFLGIPRHHVITRRFFYWIPVIGEPVKLVHAIESHVLDEWPGAKKTFLSWQSLHKELGSFSRGKRK